MTRKLTELNLFVWVSQKNARPRRFALVEQRQMNILLLVDTTIEGASPSHARQE